MSEYYKYQGAETQIDWGAVGKEMSDSIIAERNRREEKKEGLAKSQREGLKTITDFPTGELTYMNNVYAEDSQNTAEMYRLNYDQLQRGLITPKEYAAFRQTMLDSTNLLYGVAKKYQEVYGDKMKRLNSNQSQDLEAWEMEQIEGISKLKNYRIVRNPKTGEGFFVKMEVADKDWAEISKDPNNIMSAQQAMTMVSQKRDRFDLQKYSSNATKSLGAVEKQIVIEASAEGGLSKLIRTVDAKKGDYTLKGEAVKTYKNWEDKQINTIMSNPFNTTSILTNINMNTEGGEKYTFTYNRSEFDEDKTNRLIYMDRDNVSTGKPVFKREQEDDVKETIRVFLRSTIDEKYIQTAGSRRPYARTETPASPTPLAFEVAYGKFIDPNISKIDEGNPVGENLANTIEDVMESITDMPNYVVEYDDGKIKFYAREDGKRKGKPKREFDDEDIQGIKDFIKRRSLKNAMGEGGSYHTAAQRGRLIESQMGNSGGGVAAESQTGKGRYDD